MPQLSLSHTSTLAHHVAQADAWLALADAGNNTAPVGYAALELRFAVERLAVHYWAGLVAGTEDEKELMDIGPFNKIESRIYELAGHQKKIDRGFEFAETLCAMIGVTLPPGRPNMPTLRRHWHSCSEMCHIGWALSCVTPSVGRDSYETLRKAKEDIAQMVAGIGGLPRMDSPKLHKLQRDFINGQANADDIRAYVAEEGLHAQYTPPGGGQPIPMGTSIPPTRTTSPSAGEPNNAGNGDA
jgi:hypothetical protein